VGAGVGVALGSAIAVGLAIGAVGVEVAAGVITLTREASTVPSA